MKKILLATTALAFSAGFAAAEVSFSGQAKMGLKYDGGNEKETTVHSEAVLYVAMSGETDTGLAFGATIDMIVEDNGDLANDDTTVFVSGAFGKLSMGAVPEADENGGLSSIGWDDFGGDLATDDVAENISGDELGEYLDFGDYIEDSDVSFSLSHNVNYTYAADAFSVSVSARIGDENVDSAAIGGRYNFGDAYVGLGYARHSVNINDALPGDIDFDVDAKVVTAVAGGTFGAFGIAAMYSDGKVEADGVAGEANIDAYGVRASYNMDALTLTAAYSESDVSEIGFGIGDQKSYGLGAAYDLGGGALLAGGIGRAEEGDDKETVADFGITMSF
ncbi:porin [Cereibacter changlensis]|uniref:Porin n=1 Tax=Cereibacter changlensis TaxID=402884 RepID=A0A4U0Z195_9RHOB|nr:porin [Cereibacter changlensis]TKA96856.1 porin [Cereibacter changlensis]